jgi:hypothetical protein
MWNKHHPPVIQLNFLSSFQSPISHYYWSPAAPTPKIHVLEVGMAVLCWGCQITKCGQIGSKEQ